MYHLKNIVTFDGDVVVPKCMYRLKNPTEILQPDGEAINISDQVIRFLKMPSKQMSELEDRQEKLLSKLEELYHRIKTISSSCSTREPVIEKENKESTVIQQLPHETVLILSPDCLPWFQNLFTKSFNDFKISWHIHSSLPHEKIIKVKAFFTKHKELYPINNANVNFRLIFKNISAAEAKLKTSALDVPIVGIVNILRYCCIVYQNIAFYDYNDYTVDGLLDICFLLERTTIKNKEALISRLFGNCKNWIHNDKFSIVDLAAYNVIKQWQNYNKGIPKEWMAGCDRLMLKI